MPASCGKNVCSLSAACRRARNAGGVLRAVRRGHGPLRGRKKGRERGHGPLQRGAQRGFAGRFCGDGNFLPFTSRFLVVPARPRLCPFARSRRPIKSPFGRDRHIFAEVCIFKIQDTPCPRSLLRRGVFSPAEKKVKKFDGFFGILRKVYLFYGIIANRRTEECISGIQYGRAAGPSVFACRPREYVRGGSGRGRQRKYFPGTKKRKKAAET